MWWPEESSGTIYITAIAAISYCSAPGLPKWKTNRLFKMSRVQKLQAFLEEHHIRCVTPDSPDYGELRRQYISDTPAVPLGIARPKRAEDVARIVSYVVSESIDITVRSGGHEVHGRCFAQGALAIDMRDIAFVEIDADGTFATIGGGILSSSLATELTQKKLATAYGSIGSVGHVGWSTHGGKSRVLLPLRGGVRC